MSNQFHKNIDENIYYKERKYKYQITRPYTILLNITGYNISEIYFHLKEDGTLTVHALYAYDGPSGPTIDTKDSLRAALVHDVLYQMMRMKLLPEDYKDYADNLFREILIEDGMSELRADIWWEGVHVGGDSSCEAGSEEIECCAP